MSYLEIESGDELDLQSLTNRCRPEVQGTGFVKKVQRPGGRPRTRPQREAL